MSESVSFRVDRDFEVKLGKDQVAVVIPRLLFQDARAVLETVSSAIAGSTEQAFEIIAAAGNYEEQEKFPEVLGKVLQDMVVQKSYGLIKALFDKLTYGEVPDCVFDTMQYAEVVALVKYLIDQNFDSLKNLYASLQTITSSSQK